MSTLDSKGFNRSHINNDQQSILEKTFLYAKRRQAQAGIDPKSGASTANLSDMFDVGLADDGRDPASVIDDLITAAEPGLMGNTGPNFYGWVMGASCEVGMAADLLTTIWGQNAAIYQTSPSAAIAEDTASKWLLDVLDLPKHSSVGFTTGATMASFVGLCAARSEVLRRQGWNLEKYGLSGAPPIHVFVSEEAHVSIHSVLQYLGFGSRQLVKIATDSEGRMILTELEQQLSKVEGAKIVVAQAGHINSGAFDELDKIADIVETHQAWFHVDGAFGLWARATQKLTKLAKGADRADSWSVDGHKWLQVPYDSGYAIVRDKHIHRRVMNMTTSYLNHTELDGRNPSDYGPELSRRARGFATWAVLQALGRNGISDMVERHCHYAKLLRDKLDSEPGIKVMNEVVLNQLAVTFDVPESLKSASSEKDVIDKIVKIIHSENTSFINSAIWKDTTIIRVSIISGQTNGTDIELLANSIISAYQEIKNSSSLAAKIAIM